MLNFSSIMVGTCELKPLRDFYQKVFNRAPDMEDDSYAGWLVGKTFFNIGVHSEVEDEAQEPARVIFNFETDDVQGEFTRIKNIGADVIKAPYQIEDTWIATLADPDGNYFQLMPPWKARNKGIKE